MTPTWQLAALVREVHDGDTLYGWVDQGLGIWNHGTSKAGLGLRLWGCNARELAQPGGVEARDHLATLIPVGSVVPITCMAWDKYQGRIDVAVDLPGIGDLVTHLAGTGWVAPWDGTGTRPLPPWPRP